VQIAADGGIEHDDGNPVNTYRYHGKRVSEWVLFLASGTWPDKDSVRTHNGKYNKEDMRVGNLFELSQGSEYRKQFAWTARKLAKLRRMVDKGLDHPMLMIAMNCSSVILQRGLNEIKET